MRRVIGFLGSVGIGLLVTAAGLLFDAQTLIYSGISILALMLALWIWSVTSSPAPRPAALPAKAPQDDPPAGLDKKERALFALKAARSNAAVALAQRGDAAAERAFYEMEAAITSVEREFGIPRPKIRGSGTVPFKAVLQAYSKLADRIYPLLREGHIDEARAKAAAFKYSYSEE